MSSSEALMNIILDEAVPQNAPLAAKYKKSFAYPSMKDRCPVILSKIVHQLYRDEQKIVERYGEGVKEELKSAIGELSQLKNQLQTGKQFQKLTSSDPDSGIWNSHLDDLEQKGNKLNYYETNWLFAECFLYRNIREVFATKNLLNSFDPFLVFKNNLLEQSLPAITPLFNHLEKKGLLDPSLVFNDIDIKHETLFLFKCSLWTNRVDLTMSAGETDPVNDIMNEVDKWDDNIIANDLEQVYSVLRDSNNNKVIEYVMDNSGMEALNDFCLADILVTRFGFSIHFRVKPKTWFVSDVTIHDFNNIIDTILTREEPIFQKMGSRWKDYLESGIWTIKSDIYWCLGLSFSEMSEDDPALYESLSKASLVIFKGDLNYRKLLQDKNWEPTTSFHTALGKFHPAPLVTLRTCKVDLICGLKSGVAEIMNEKYPGWMICTDFGVIQFDSPKY